MGQEIESQDWINAVKARGWGDALTLALDALEPLGPLGAQLLWVTQPVLGLVVNRAALGDLAQRLETPGGIALLRQMLEED
ncbi:MAG: hypothetical protein H6672_19805 [Anaerolineaceae bacterium]|nr:hypothetical protein [Anaerolineaceae bacterium]